MAGINITRDDRAAIIDGLLRLAAVGGVVSTALLAPNAVQIFDKPLSKLLDKLDERSRERELRRTVYYMKSRGLIKYATGDYEHGLKITKRGRDRLRKTAYSKLAIVAPAKWDKKWRLVFFDIPVSGNNARAALTGKLRRLGFQQLQRSIWVHPFPCRAEIETVASALKVEKFITYIEIGQIDAEEKLRLRFRGLFSSSLA